MRHLFPRYSPCSVLSRLGTLSQSYILPGEELSLAVATLPTMRHGEYSPKRHSPCSILSRLGTLSQSYTLPGKEFSLLRTLSLVRTAECSS